jgi:hypothetical protein
VRCPGFLDQLQGSDDRFLSAFSLRFVGIAECAELASMMELLIYPVNYVIWRKRELGFMNNVKLQTRQLPIVRRLLLRNLLGAGSVFLFLICRVRLRLFLRRLLARRFRRFVAHEQNAKVRGNQRQLSGRESSRWAPAPISGALDKGSRDTGAVTPCCMYNACHGCPIVVQYSVE